MRLTAVREDAEGLREATLPKTPSPQNKGRPWQRKDRPRTSGALQGRAVLYIRNASHTCNFKSYSRHIAKANKTGEIRFHNVSCLMAQDI